MPAFTRQDVIALIKLLTTLLIMTIVLWLGLRALTPLQISSSDAYIISAVLLAAFHLVRRHVRKSRVADPDERADERAEH